jgi:hypothetical protein
MLHPTELDTWLLDHTRRVNDVDRRGWLRSSSGRRPFVRRLGVVAAIARVSAATPARTPVPASGSRG